MNPLRCIDRDWFWGTLALLTICLLIHCRLTVPKPRPTEPVPPEATQTR